MSFIRKLAGQTAIYGIPGILSRTLNFLLTIVHTGVFMPGSYGAITELYAISGFIMVALLYGMETAFFRFTQKEDEHRVFNTLQSGIWITTLTFFGAVTLFQEPLSQAMGYGNTSHLIFLIALILSLDALAAIPLVKLRHREKAVQFVTINTLSVVINIGLNLYFFLYCFPKSEAGSTFLGSAWFDPTLGVAYVFIANAAASGFKFLASLLVGIPRFLHFSWSLWKQAFRYSWPIAIIGIAGLTNEAIDRTLMKPLLTPILGATEAQYQLGVYGACYKLAILINICVQAFRYAAEPLFFKNTGKANKENMRKTLNYLGGFVLLVFITVSLYIDYFKLFIRSEEYWTGLGVVPILLLANCFFAMHVQISMWYKLADKTKLGALLSATAAGLTLLGNIMLIPVLGYMGAAITTLVVYAFLPAASLYLSKKHYPIPYNLGNIALYFALAISIVVLGYYLYPNMLFGFKALLILLFIAVFCLREKIAIPRYGSRNRK